MRDELNVVYVQTPFHVRTFLQLIDTELFKAVSWIVFYDKLVEVEINKKFGRFKRIEVNIDLTYYGTDSNLFYIYKRVKRGLEIRKKVQNYAQLLNSIIQEVEIRNFVCFSEKNIFSQLVLKTINDTTIAWSIDEGFAHYVTPNKFDCFKKIIYPLLTPLILGFPYQFYRIHGTHLRFNKLVLRLPKRRLVKSSATIVSFNEIGIKNNFKKNSVYRGDESKSVLILTLPYEGITVFNDNGFKSIDKIINDLIKLNYEIFVKPHPREQINKYKAFGDKIVLIDKSIPFEDIDYFHFSYIVSEISSTAIELLNSDFPKEKLIFLNIDIWGKQLKAFFRNVKMLYCGEPISKFIKNDVETNLSIPKSNFKKGV